MAIRRWASDVRLCQPGSEKLARQEAIKQIERRRRFKISTVVSGLGMIILVAIWALTEREMERQSGRSR